MRNSRRAGATTLGGRHRVQRERAGPGGLTKLRNLVAGSADAPAPAVFDDVDVLEVRDLTMGCFAHDVRSPLAASRSALSYLLDGPTDDAQSRRLLEATKQSLEEIESLLDRVIDLDRVRATVDGRQVEQVDLAAAIRDAVAACTQPDRVTVDLRQATVDGIPVLLERALANLIENGIRHGTEQVHVALAFTTDGVLVTVDDDGVGVPERDRQLIFEPFVRLRDDTPGFGLGLTMVRRIAELHRGGIWVESGRLGGAAFRLWLPTTLAGELEIR